ncbi:hypothetical protein [Chryseobacterium koreense]
MKALLTLTVSILILSCNVNDKTGQKTSTLTNSVTHEIAVKKHQEKNHPSIDLIYESENIRIYGDTTIDRNKISYTSTKFEPYISFQDFKVKQIDHSRKVELDFKSNKDAKSFKTKLREGFNADTANFAGHYTFVYWGCGSPCQSSMLIDRQTGKIYDSPSAALGYEFRADSRMLIVNPPDANGFYDDCPYCKPVIYIFDELTKKFNEKSVK